jgi:nucleoside-diphosphate-sugar epimerase
MKLLIIGGTGIISSAVTHLAVQRGMDVSVLNRGKQSSYYEANANIIVCDYFDESAFLDAVGNTHFDCVIDFINMDAATMGYALKLWRGRTDQYIFISSASVYEKPLKNPVVTEETPLGNRYWQYSRNKIEAEKMIGCHVAKGFPGVIVRPSLTYSDFNIYFSLYSPRSQYAVFDRMLRGKPVIVQGDGLSLWGITHNSDFAKGILGLVGNRASIGETFHITTDEVLTWDWIYKYAGKALGVEPVLHHVASEKIIKHYPEREGILLGDHSNSVIFDNSKIKSFVPDFKCTVPFEEGARRCVAWFDAHPEMKVFDAEWDKEMDELAKL